MSIAFKQTTCQSKDWSVGFGLLNYKTECLSSGNQNVEINMVATDDSKIIEDRILSSFKFISSSSEINGSNSSSKTMDVNIQIPDNVEQYLGAMNEWIFDDSPNGGKLNPSFSWKFISKRVTVPYTKGVIKASAQAAAEQIPTQGGTPSAEVVYLKIVDKTAYILLAMQIDGWAGSSASLAKIKPLVERTILQFSDINFVKFEPAPGDSKEQISNSYQKSLVTEPSITVLSPNGGEIIKVGDTFPIKWSTSGDIVDGLTITLNKYVPECYSAGKYICPPSLPTLPLTIVEDAPSIGQYNWFVKDLKYSGQISEGKYTINIQGRSKDEAYVFDSSDNYFTITNLYNSPYGVQGKCGLDINYPYAYSRVKFPLTITGTVDNSNSQELGCSWQIWEGYVATAQLYYNYNNTGWKALGESVKLIATDSYRDTTTISARISLDDGIELPNNTPMKIVFTEENPAVSNPSDIFELLFNFTN